MPNWCFCKLTVSGPEESLDSFCEKVSRIDDPVLKAKLFGDEELPALCFASTVPPEKIDFDSDDLKTLWGTKWEADNSENNVEEHGNDIVWFEFCTAWNPPIEWLKATALLFPDLEFTLCYAEPGEGFSGTAYAQGEDFQEDENDEVDPEIAEELGLTLFDEINENDDEEEGPEE